jgi:uncharacterized protein with NAD-binding domain and iron-sulfur cluster
LAGDAARKMTIRVAIVGGGSAGIAAAWQLAKMPGYEIEVFEKSARLGGKGASVRAPDGRILEHGLHVWLGFYENAFRMMRECYAEVEREGWGPDSKESEKRLAHSGIDEAFYPEPHVGLGPADPQRGWSVWSAYLPPATGLPGEALDEQTNPFTLVNYLLRSLELLRALMLSVIGPPADDAPGEPRPDKRSISDQTLDFGSSSDDPTSMALAIKRTAELLRGSALVGAAVLLQAVTILEVWLQNLNFGLQVADSILDLAEALAAQARKFLRDFVQIDPDVRVKTVIADLVLTIAVGLFRDRVLFDDKGLDLINHEDYREWLRRHGLTDEAYNSSFLTGIYDLAFAYSGGDRTKPALAAGVALRGALRMFFTYRGSMFWRLGSGMGDAVFAPLYKVLKSPRREDGKRLSPVRFHFLHELAHVGVERMSGSKYVTSLKFRTIPDTAALNYLSDNALDGFGCWPDLSDGLAGAAKSYERVLKRGEDFDAVILAIGVDDLHEACRPSAPAKTLAGSSSAPAKESPVGSELGAHWPAMFVNVRTVATQSAQVWLQEDLEGLGWWRGTGLVTSLGLSFDTWADMTPVLATEEWRAADASNAGRKPRSLAYFCAPMQDSTIQAALDKASVAHSELLGEMSGVAEAARLDGLTQQAVTKVTPPLPSWVELSTNVPEPFGGRAGASAAAPREGEVLPLSFLAQRAVESQVGLDLVHLIQKDLLPLWPKAFKKDGDGPERFDETGLIIKGRVQANFEGSDRYTLSEPGLITHRISPLDRSVENMTIAGDWTACGLDVGCVEAAVISGLLASHAISGKPDLTEIIGFDHP